MKKFHVSNPKIFSSNRNAITFIIFLTCLLLAVLLSFAQENQYRGATDIVHIPDANLKAALLANAELNTTADEEITQGEASAFGGELNLSNLGITDPTGIESFSSLIVLNLRDNSLGAIDVSSNVSLLELNLRNTGLTSIDVANLTQLTYLELELNDLSTINLSSNTALTDLLLQGNNLTSIDLSQNTALRSVRLHVNPLTSVDFSNNPSITSILLNQTNLTSLDVSNQPNLSYLSLRETQLTSVDLSGNPNLDNLNLQSNTVMTDLDLSANGDLRVLSLLNSTGLTSVDLRNGNNENLESINFNGTSSLTCIAVDDVVYATENWTFIDVANEFKTYCDPNDPVHIPDENFKAALLANSSLNTTDDDEITYGEAEAYAGTISASALGIADLTGVEAFTEITQLIVNLNDLTALDISSNTKLTLLYATNNLIDELDLSSNTELQNISVIRNEMSSLTLGLKPDLTMLWCYENDLTSLDVSGSPSIQELRAQSNLLTSIDLSPLIGLERLNVKDNQLTALNTSNSPLLWDIECGENEIASLDLSNNEALETIQTHENNLTELDVSNNPLLYRITAFYNDLTSIDLSNNPLITSLGLEYNQLSTIDVSNLTGLISFKVRGNQLTDVNIKNGNNTSLTNVLLDQNPELMCVQVDDPAYSEANWTSIDEIANFSTDCDVVEFSDENFENALLADNGINPNEDNFIQTSEAEAFDGTMNVSNQSINDLTGIAAFGNITVLDVSENTLSSIDVSNNTKLISLDLKDNQLSTIDLSQNADLEYLSIYNNNFSSLDVSANTVLTDLIVRNNSITSLDLSNNLLLTFINVMGNGMSSLVIGANEVLEYIAMDFNDFTEFDISGYPNINQIAFSGNSMLESMNVANGNNSNFLFYRANDNPLLTCVTVDDPAFSEANWALVDDHVGYSTNCSNDATDILTFSVDGMVGNATIDAINHTVEATVNSTVNLSSLEPTITLSDGATISLSGAQDFTSSVTYTVAAEDNSTTQDWSVTITAIPLGLEDIDEVEIYPNPTNAYVTVRGVSGSYRWQLRSLSGKLLNWGTDKDRKIDLAQQDNGLYLLQINTEKGSNQIYRIVKTN